MARTKGSANFAGSLETQAGAPLDARCIVPTESDLVLASNFPYSYIGMLVAVQSNGKVYELTAKPTTTFANWRDLGELEFGYLNPNDGVFYTDAQYTYELLGDQKKLYLTLDTNSIYRYDGTHYVQISGGGTSLPSGGSTGQALVKHSNSDGDVEWANVTITVDSALDATSENPVQNKVVKGALDGKVDTVSGKGLSTEDYTTAEKTKLAGIDTNNFIPTTEKGANNGVASLGSNGKIPMSQIPSGLDDIIDGYRNPSDGLFYEESSYTTPITGGSGIIYFDVPREESGEAIGGLYWRWNGSAFVTFGDALVLGEVTGTAYDGGKGKANRDAINAIKDGQSIDSFGDVESALDDKVDKVSGKGLSTNDFTDAYKQSIDNLDVDITGKQDKTLSSAQTIEGTSVTTVEGGVTATRVHTEKSVTDANGVHGFKADTSGTKNKIFYKSGNTWVEIPTSPETQYSTLPTASQSLVGKVYQYTGADDAVNGYYHGYFYECVSDGQGGYEWTNMPVMYAEQIQVASLPTASADELGNVYQYIGTTTADYRKCYFYECVLDGATYKWIGARVQAGGGQTIQYDTMPMASAETLGDVVWYTGITTVSYTHNFMYECVALETDPVTYDWVQTNVQPDSGIPLVDTIIDLNEADLPNELIQYVGETTSDFTKGVVYEIAPLIAELSNDDILLHYTMESSTETQTYTATEHKTIFALVLCLGGGGTQSITTTGAELWSYEKNDQALDIGKGNILTKIIEVDSGDTITYSGSANTRTRQVFMLMDYGDKPNEMNQVLFEGSNDFITTPYTATYTVDEDCAILAIGMACRMSTGSGYAYSLSTKINNEIITDKKARVAENKYAVDVVSRYMKTGDTVDFSGTSGASESYASAGVMYYVFKLGHSTVPCSPSRASNSQIEEIKAQFNPSSTANVSFKPYNVYSPNEQVIGEWQEVRDGVLKKKPLYEKTISCGLMPDTSTKSVSPNVTNLDTIFDIHGVCVGNGLTKPIPMVHTSILGNQIFLDYNNDEGGIRIITGSGYYASMNGYITIQYTKTTDTWENV